MGEDKANLDLGGQPLLAHVLARVAERCDPIVVAARPGQTLPAVAGLEPVRIDDPVADAGPLVGLAQALAWLAARGVSEAYLGSCDAAGLSRTHLDFVLDRLARARAERGAIAVVPVDADGRRHPLASAVAVAPMSTRASSLLAAGRGRLQALFDPGDDGPIVEVPVAELPDPEALRPCNTPDEWRAWLERLSRRSAGPR